MPSASESIDILVKSLIFLESRKYEVICAILGQLEHKKHVFLFHVSHKIRTDEGRTI